MHCKVTVTLYYLEDESSATTEENVEDTTMESVLEVSDKTK